MKWKNCEKKDYENEECWYNPLLEEEEAAEEDDAEEIPDDATTFYVDMFPFWGNLQLQNHDDHY